MENRINWHYTRRSEWKRLAVPCGRAGSAATFSRPLWMCGKRIYTQQDVDVVACASIFKINPRFPFNVKIGLFSKLSGAGLADPFHQERKHSFLFEAF